MHQIGDQAGPERTSNTDTGLAAYVTNASSAIGFMSVRYNQPLLMKHRNSDDEELFGEAVRDVKPLRHNLADPKSNRTALPLKQSAPDESPAEFGEELRFLRPGIQS